MPGALQSAERKSEETPVIVYNWTITCPAVNVRV